MSTFFLGENMDEYLHYIGGTAGAVTLSAVAAATAYYYATRPSPDTPFVPLDNQSPILDVSTDLKAAISVVFFCCCNL